MTFGECTNLIFSGHAVRRMFERGVTPSDVRLALSSGELIEDYPDDEPFPSCLVLGWAGEHPLHLVMALDVVSQTGHVITVYRPAPEKWETGFRTRRPK